MTAAAFITTLTVFILGECVVMVAKAIAAENAAAGPTMTEAITEPQRAAMIAGFRSIVIKAAVARLIDAAVKPKPRFYRVREAALGTASYETILRTRGPLGPLMTRDQAQTAIILSGLAMGIITRDANGNLVRV